jgi:signal transduction histidine kinase
VKYPAEATLPRQTAESEAAGALAGKRSYTFATIDGTDHVVAALPVKVRLAGRTEHWALIVRKPISEVSTAVSAVRTALLDATLVAAALTLLLAIPFASTVVRRLRRLRQTALRVAHEGPSVEIPSDRARDEVGDLTRTFALMQHQLRRQESARRAFVATASHELRTPVASLDGLLELMDEDLRSGNPDLDDARSLLERARAQSRRLGRLAADLLDLSRIDAEITLRSEPVELGELSRAVLAEFEVASNTRGVTTSLDDHGGSVWALGDPGSVARILRILVDNAVGVSPEQGRITVRLHNGDGEHAQLSVCDQGPGVHPEERDLIFERFMRGRDSGGRGGFGLGLAIGRELARRMGGELVLEEQNGPGARFTLRLPVAQAPQEEPVAVL